MLVVQFPQPRPDTLLPEQDGHEVPLVHVRVDPRVADDVDEPDDEHHQPDREDDHPGTGVGCACRRRSGQVWYPDRITRTTQGTIRHGRTSYGAGPAVSPQGEAAEAEAKAGRRPRRSPREDPGQDPRPQPVLDGDEEGLIVSGEW